MKTLFAFILGLILAGLTKVSADEHRVEPVPLVHASAPVQAPMLFSPCPVQPRNFPRINFERRA